MENNNKRLPYSHKFSYLQWVYTIYGCPGVWDNQRYISETYNCYRVAQDASKLNEWPIFYTQCL